LIYLIKNWNRVDRNSILVQAFLRKWWVESDFKAPNLPLSLRLKGSGCHYSSIYNNTVISNIWYPFLLSSVVYQVNILINLTYHYDIMMFERLLKNIILVPTVTSILLQKKNVLILLKQWLNKILSNLKSARVWKLYI
jgi:hypothetical protein